MDLRRVAPRLSMDDVLRERALALLVDAAVVGAVGALAVVGLGVGWAALAAFPAIWMVYATVLQGRYGQTLGKATAGVVVVGKDGDPCDYRAAALRELLRIVDVALAPLLGVMFVFRSRRCQRIGDLVADTIVVRARSEASSL